jgi:hypothetical protein
MAVFMGILPLKAQASSDTLIYAWPDNNTVQKAILYPIDLLELLAEHAEPPLIISPKLIDQPQSRTLYNLSKGTSSDNAVNIIWSFSTPEREERLLPIKIPIDRGLLGWRLFMTRSEDQERLKNISLDSLKQLRMVQGHDWPDLEILQANGFNAVSTTTYDGMLRMLELGRVQLFPRSINEIFYELKEFPLKDIVIDQHWAIEYPAPMYYFVSKDNQILADRLENAFTTILENGKFEELFLRYFGEVIEKAQLDQRRVLHLKNPLFVDSTLRMNEQMWFKMDEGF